MMELFGSILDILERAVVVLAPWLRLIFWAGFCYQVGQAMKSGPLSDERAREVPWVRFVRRWFPLPLHPIAASAVVALLPWETALGADYFGRWLYYGGGGFVAVYGHDIYSQHSKWRAEKKE
jgi:hypothetical protein